jgi:hypothetical protein
MMSLDGESQSQSLYRQGMDKMKEPTANEQEPFKERYDARGYFEICVAMSAGSEEKSVLTRALC